MNLNALSDQPSHPAPRHAHPPHRKRSRSHARRLLPHLLSTWGGDYTIDLATCYGGLPEGLPAGTKVFRVTDYKPPKRAAN